MIPAPSTRFTQAIKGSHDRRVRVTLLAWANGALQDVGEVGVASGSMIIDSTAASWRRFSGSLTLPPDTLAELADKSTFNGELKFETGIAFSDAVEWVQVGQLRLEEFVLSTGSASVSVTAFDRASRVADFPFVTPYAPRAMDGSRLGVIDAIRDIITTAFPSANPPEFVVDPSLDATAMPPPETVFTGARWDAVMTLAQSIGGVVHNDNVGRFVIRSKRPESSTVDTLRSGVMGTVVSVDASTTRVEQYNAVGLTCESPSQEAIFVYVVDNDPASPTYYDGPWGRKPLLERNDAVTSVDEALHAARIILARRKSAARDMTISALYNPLLQPLDSVLVLEDVSLDIGEAHTIESIELPLTSAQMVLKTFRWSVPPPAWRDLRANKTWADVPPATTWGDVVTVDSITPA